MHSDRLYTQKRDAIIPDTFALYAHGSGLSVIRKFHASILFVMCHEEDKGEHMTRGFPIFLEITDLS